MLLFSCQLSTEGHVIQQDEGHPSLKAIIIIITDFI